MLIWVLPALALLALGSWAYLLLGRGGFWRLEPRLRLEPPQEDPPRGWPPVVAVMPARNEADLLPSTLPAVLTQDYPGPFSVCLVDDHSTDGTADLACRLAREVGQEGRLTVTTPPPLPAGWTGKVWALQHGLEATRPTDAPYLWLVDADTRHPPSALRALVSRAEAGGYDLVSLLPRLRAQTFWERLLMPAFAFFFLMLYPFRWLNDPRRREAGAVGMSVLLRRDRLESAGGFRPIAGALIDDCALGALIKRHGGRLFVAVAEDAESLRPHPTLGSVWQMVARTAYVQLGFSPLWLLATVLGLGLAYLYPPLALALGLAGPVLGMAPLPSLLTAGLGALAWGLMALAYLPTLRWEGVPLRYAPFLPLIAGLYTGMTLDSALRYTFGKGGQWRGRTYAREPRAPDG